ncbi:thiosulfate oxidation carrier complex protein SoxZ [Magnetofaba australis]|uniref:Putative sulfur compound chelating protein SoxZ n=1 Tax=Magnetofaba australis IT-1 TaxID=1434232 RepID=A0A1Y2K4P1_9PROT|nr:thiosulfate oxidation carrier complex protein SoxZ [Magnetofaba australis]OSM02094.1 putative sulfur compound chelating protein SoxZ [Magnetofaba australis IT-1]
MANIGNPKVRGPRKPVAKDSIVTIKTMIKHPMESGLRKDSATGDLIPAHHIVLFEAEYLGKKILSADWTGGVSKNPFFSFDMKASATGDVKVTWKDNKGGEWSESASLTVS